MPTPLCDQAASHQNYSRCACCFSAFYVCCFVAPLQGVSDNSRLSPFHFSRLSRSGSFSFVYIVCSSPNHLDHLPLNFLWYITVLLLGNPKWTQLSDGDPCCCVAASSLPLLCGDTADCRVACLPDHFQALHYKAAFLPFVSSLYCRRLLHPRGRAVHLPLNFSRFLLFCFSNLSVSL